MDQHVEIVSTSPARLEDGPRGASYSVPCRDWEP